MTYTIASPALYGAFWGFPQRLLNEYVRCSFETILPSPNREFLKLAPRGSSTILVLPGLGADDSSTKELRQFLSSLGHKVHGWGNGFNYGANPQIGQYLTDLLGKHSHPNNPISIIGWSLGGKFAREMAKASPDLVDRVITFGTPHSVGRHPNAMVEGLHDFFSLFPGADMDYLGLKPSQGNHPLPPIISVYSDGDDIVPSETSAVYGGDISECIKVSPISHSGLISFPQALLIAADRAAAKKTTNKDGTVTLRPFNPDDYPEAAFPPQEQPPEIINVRATQQRSQPLPLGALNIK